MAANTAAPNIPSPTLNLFPAPVTCTGPVVVTALALVVLVTFAIELPTVFTDPAALAYGITTVGVLPIA